MYVLVSSAGGWTQDVFGDLGRILSSCTGVVSADIPAATEKLAAVISRDPKKEQFLNDEPQVALDWLQNHNGESGKQFKEFLKTHGHRCVNEFDLHRKPWGMDPLPLMATLQSLLKNKGSSSNKTNLSISETIAGLKVPVSWKQKQLLKLLIPLARRGVICREYSKSIVIKYVDILRRPLFHIAKKMVQEGRLPEEDIFFYLTIDEIFLLIETRSPKLIQKAMKRRALRPKVNGYKFDEICKGFPKPVNKILKPNGPVEVTFTMKGVPVSEGVVKAPCRVAVDLEDAKLIKPGEVLIAYGTDIGWSPYFPMLSGVATELGGLVSHGAVVAREYGLPCVVGLHGATDRFKSGDIVLLDGTKGLIQKVQ